MPGWFTDNAWAVWFVIAGILAVSEMLTLDLTLLMLAVGAAAGGVTALLLPGLIWAQILVALVTALMTLFLVRPKMLKRFRAGTGYRSAMDQVVGSTGTLVKEIGTGAGEVKLGGDTWTARSYDGEPIAAGTQVDVLEVDGAVLVVHPTFKALG